MIIYSALTQIEPLVFLMTYGRVTGVLNLNCRAWRLTGLQKRLNRLYIRA